jgi:hypothetical protein
LPWVSRVIALCHEMIFNGSNVAFRRSVRSIATLEEYRKPAETISWKNGKPSKNTLLS